MQVDLRQNLFMFIFMCIMTIMRAPSILTLNLKAISLHKLISYVMVVVVQWQIFVFPVEDLMYESLQQKT